MGTRSLTIVAEKDGGVEDVVMYRQMDGYLEGHGTELLDAFEHIQICNGYGVGQEVGKWANGMGCLAAQIVAHFKDGIGGFYLYPSGTRDTGEEYIYYLYPKLVSVQGTEKLYLRVIEAGWGDTPAKILYDGLISEAREGFKAV
jgi:hypothetical protein